jgi:hypothetical protein
VLGGREGESIYEGYIQERLEGIGYWVLGIGDWILVEIR